MEFRFRNDQVKYLILNIFYIFATSKKGDFFGAMGSGESGLSNTF